MKQDTNLREAAYESFRRKRRTSHPKGYFERNGTWYPDDTEKQSCCDAIRTPSAKYPYSLMNHCRTLEHVANLYKVDKKDLKRAIKKSQKEIRNVEFKGVFYIKGPEIKAKVYQAMIGNKYIVICSFIDRTDNPTVREIPFSLEDDMVDLMMQWDSAIEWWKGPWKHGLFHMKPMDPTKNSTYRPEVWAHYRFVNKKNLFEIFLDMVS